MGLTFTEPDLMDFDFGSTRKSPFKKAPLILDNRNQLTFKFFREKNIIIR